MHEMALTQGIVELCEQHAAGKPVQVVVVEIGTLSGVVPEAVAFCFEACCSGTLLEGARLEIRTIPGRGWCQECRQEQAMERLFDSCGSCGSYLLEVRRGNELRVVEIDVADEYDKG